LICKIAHRTLLAALLNIILVADPEFPRYCNEAGGLIPKFV
jgi:hypothetical protein